MHMRADSLNDKIANRPKPDELIKEGILDGEWCRGQAGGSSLTAVHQPMRIRPRNDRHLERAWRVDLGRRATSEVMVDGTHIWTSSMLYLHALTNDDPAVLCPPEMPKNPSVAPCETRGAGRMLHNVIDVKRRIAVVLRPLTLSQVSLHPGGNFGSDRYLACRQSLPLWSDARDKSPCAC